MKLFFGKLVVIVESDWLHLFLPIVGIEIFWPGLLLLGFSAGIINGCFGSCGWMVVPGLIIFGIPILFAVGTNAAFVAGKRVVFSFTRFGLGSISFKPALSMLIGSVAGIEGGAYLLALLDRSGQGGSVLLWIYALLFLVSALSFLFDFFPVRGDSSADAHLPGRVLAPFVRLAGASFDAAMLAPFILGLIFGFLLGFLGIGGGVFRLALMTGVWSGFTAVETSTHVLEGVISSLYGAFTFTLKGWVEVLALFMLIVSEVVGDRIGLAAAGYTNSETMRLGPGLVMLCGMAAVILMVTGQSYPAMILLLSSLGGFSLCIILGLAAGVARASSSRRSNYGSDKK